MTSSRTLWQQLLASQNLASGTQDLFWCNYERSVKIRIKYEFLWALTAAQAVRKEGWMRLDMVLSMRNAYISSNLDLATKFKSSNRSTQIKRYTPMEHPLDNHKNNFNQLWDQSKPMQLKGATLFELERISMQTGTITEFLYWDSHYKINIKVKR